MKAPLARRIFISHSHKDSILTQAWNDLVIKALAKRVEVWSSSDTRPDEGIKGGDQWEAELRDRLNKADHVIALLTAQSVNNDWVHWECGIASAAKPAKMLIPVRFEITPEAVKKSPLGSYQSVDGVDRTAVMKKVQEIGKAAGMELAEESLAPLLDAYLQTIKTYTEAHPFAEELQELIREYRGVPHLSEKGGLSVFHVNFAGYTAFLRQLLKELCKEGKPECLIYNVLQPRTYVEKYLSFEEERRKDGSLDEEQESVSLERVLRDYPNLSPERLARFRERVVGVSRQVFPSIRVIEEISANDLGRCTRYTVLQSRPLPGHVWFMDQLMGASEYHYVLDPVLTGRAFQDVAVHRSDFCIWKNRGITGVTNYYENGLALVVYWSLAGSNAPAYITRCEGIMQALRFVDPPRISRFLENGEVTS